MVCVEGCGKRLWLRGVSARRRVVPSTIRISRPWSRFRAGAWAHAAFLEWWSAWCRRVVGKRPRALEKAPVVAAQSSGLESSSRERRW